MSQWLNRLRKKSLLGAEGIPQRLKPNALQSIYVRPEGRTLKKNEFSAACKVRRILNVYGPNKSCPDTKHESSS